jgi:hypothetical protein
MQFKEYSEEQKISYIKDAHDIATLIESLGFRTHIQFGALLGLVREKKLIDTDTDIDICVIANASDPEGVVQDAKKLFTALNDKVWIWRYFDETGTRQKEINRPFGQIFINTKNPNLPCPLIDVSFAWINNGDYWHCIWGNLFKFQGLDKDQIYGFEFNIPRSPELLLDKIYGNDWMQPKLTKAHHRIKHTPILYNLIKT